jgi:hypothetical protein
VDTTKELGDPLVDTIQVTPIAGKCYACKFSEEPIGSECFLWCVVCYQSCYRARQQSGDCKPQATLWESKEAPMKYVAHCVYDDGVILVAGVFKEEKK